MLFSYNWLNDYLQYKISPQEIGELLTMHAFEVESVSKKGDDWILAIDVLPNRAPDASCHQGIAREVNALAGFLGTFQKKKSKTIWELQGSRTPTNNASAVTITVENKSDCPLYQALLVSHIHVAQSPPWLKARLASVGISSINNIVDISNYLMLDMGQPTHIFDAGMVESQSGQPHIIVRRAKHQEALKLLGGVKAVLNQDDLVIADRKKTLALAGVKGGQTLSVTLATTSILIEAAVFNRQAIYQTARRLNLQTESAKRFSAGIPQGFVARGLATITQLIQQLAGGEVIGYGRFEEREERPPIIITHARINSLIGTSLPEETITSILFQLGFEVQKERAGVFKVHAPFWRMDCQIPEDIIEEISRFYGLDTIPSVIPRVSLGEPLTDDARALRSFVREYLSAQGFDELYNYSLRSSQQPAASSQHFVKLLNPISEERAYLRDNLVDGLLKNIAENQGLFHTMKLFEIGRVFWREGTGVGEKEHIAGVLFGKQEADFREARGVVEGLLEALGFDVDDYLFEDKSATLPHPFLALSINGELCGSIEIPESPRQVKIKGKVVAFEIDAEALFSQVSKEREFQPPPKFPAVVRDVSLLLSSRVNGDRVIQIIHEVGKDLIEDVDLFDVYEEPDQEDRSLAFHIIYRSEEKTLTDEEVNALHHTIEKELTKRLHAQIR